MKPDLSRWAPPGLDLHVEKRVFGCGMALSTLFSMFYIINLFGERAKLYRKVGTEVHLRPDAVMPDFVDVLRPFLMGFLILALCMAAFIAVHYAYHHQGSKSIYLMRRLPDRWERHRRCWTLPLLGIAACLLAALILLLIYYGLYMLATPKACLTPHQWQKIWRVIS